MPLNATGLSGIRIVMLVSAAGSGAGSSVAGSSVAGSSVAGASVAGASVAGASVAGASVGASSVSWGLHPKVRPANKTSVTTRANFLNRPKLSISSSFVLEMILTDLVNPL